MIAPNPFDAQLRIVNGALRGVYTLFNAQGVALLSGTLDATETHLNTTKLSAGFYYMQLTEQNGATKTYSVVKP